LVEDITMEGLEKTSDNSTPSGGTGPKGVVVIGGGIAGIQAALELADSGIKVYLIERSPTLGGKMAQLDKTFPTNDCSMCILSPKLVSVGRHPNIDLLTLSEVVKVEGEAPDLSVTVLKHPRYVDEIKCVGCGACAEKCPSKVRDEFDMELSYRKAIYIPFPQAIPLKYNVDKKNCIYFKMLAKGKKGACLLCEKACEAEAIDHHMEEEEVVINAGAIILTAGYDLIDPTVKKEYGYGTFENVVTALEFERIISASGPFQGHIKRPSDNSTPKKVAWLSCVGSRDDRIGKGYCSTVCCMYSAKEAVMAKEHLPDLETSFFFMDFRAMGKEFDDFYKRAQRVGIKFIRSRVSNIEELQDHSLELKYATEDGVLHNDSYDMVVLSTGMTPNRETKRISDVLGLELDDLGFCRYDYFKPMETSRDGIYIGGTFAGPKDIPDTISQALGAASKAATHIHPSNYQAPPQTPEEKDISGLEPRIGVFICHCGSNIAGVIDVKEVAEFAKGLPGVVHSQTLLYACSQDSLQNIQSLIDEHQLNRVVVASCTPRTHEPLFRSTIQEKGLNPFLFDQVNIRESCSWIHSQEPQMATQKAKDLVKMSVARSQMLEPLEIERMPVNKNALVIGGGIAGLTAARQIASNGFKVFLIEKEGEFGGILNRVSSHIVTEDPKAHLTSLIEQVSNDDNIRIFLDTEIEDISGYIGNFTTKLNRTGITEEITHGVIVVASGGQTYTPSEYEYQKHGSIITQLELEEKLREPDFKPKSVVMIQCVGSRDDEHPYCSKICCTVAVKNALHIKESNPNAEVMVLYKDIRTYGDKEHYYREAREAGVLFARWDDDCIPSVEVDGDDILVTFYDHILGRRFRLRPENLVLSTGIRPGVDNENLSKKLKVPLTKDKFFFEAHVKLRPVDFATEGIFLCGAAHSPQFSNECISQATAAASRAITILQKDFVEGEGVPSVIDSDLCSGCGTCELICPYGAIEHDESGKRKVIAVMCKGCGACRASCPELAITAPHFQNDQLKAQVNALFESDPSDEKVIGDSVSCQEEVGE